MSLETTRVFLRGRQKVRVASGKCENRSQRLERSCLKSRTCDGHPKLEEQSSPLEHAKEATPDSNCLLACWVVDLLLNYKQTCLCVLSY